MFRFVAARDHRIMRRLHNWRAPRWVRIWMTWATRGGDGWLWYALCLAVLLFGGPERFSAVAAAGLAGGAGVLIYATLKRMTNRARPCALEPHCWANLLPPDRFSFPSGHSLSAFAVTVPLALFYPSLFAGLMFCAASVAISRVVLGMHFLSDVLAGSALGAALGYGAFSLVR